MRIEAASVVAPEAIEACLAVIEARDPLVLHAELEPVLAADARVALDDEGRVAGVGWRSPAGADAYWIDVRVPPGRRRRGIGAALLDTLAEGAAGGLRASCDAGHPRATRFLEHHGFRETGVLFFQRWDGPPEDVARGFPSAELRDEADLEAACALITAHEPPGWRRDALTVEGLSAAEGGFARSAWVDGLRVGALVAQQGADAIDVESLVVQPAARNRGVGRCLLTDVMARAAAASFGVTVRVAGDDNYTLRWTRSLGFWTYRSWACYARP